MSEVTAIATRQENSMSLASAALTIQDLIEQKKVIAECMKELMHKDEHYGVIPGAKKPSLFKPGADLIGFMFRLDAEYDDLEVIHEPGYIYYRVKCTLTHIPTGRRVGSGVGSCNSRESKYVRPAAKKCPNCSGEFIIEGNPDYEKDAAYKGGTLCYKKKGGCGAKFKPGDPAIDGQATGAADPSDLDNTICKMAHKRARVDAILTTTAASDFFTQDVEDLTGKAAEYEYVPPGETESLRATVGQEPPRPKAAPVPSAAPSPSSVAATSKGGSGPKAGAVVATAANGAGSQAATVITTATQTSGATASATKAPRANTIKHDGTFASHKQVALLHLLKAKVGGMSDDMYRKQLAAFKDCDGKAITTSKDLSEAQISNLIDRYEKKIKEQEARAAEQPDLGVIDEATAPQLSELEAAVAGDEARIEAICETLRVMSISDIRTKERASQAIALAIAFGTGAFEPLRKKIMAQVQP